jgi:putative transposase
MATGRKLRVPTVLDIFSRYSPAIDPRYTYRGENVMQVLERTCAEIGYPRTIRVDQGSEFVSSDLDLWAYARGVTLDFSRPDQATYNAYIEAFNGRFRAECLNQHWLLTLAGAREEMEDCHVEYNEVRPHSAIGDRPLMDLLHQSLDTPEAVSRPELFT